jgi:ribosomal protein S18 acetylase RimI-like enzyme
MLPLLRNPVYHSLLGIDRHLGAGPGQVLWFDEAVSPFAGFAEGDAQGFDLLYKLLPAGRNILIASPTPIEMPSQWVLRIAIEGLQFLFQGNTMEMPEHFSSLKLQIEHVPQMMELAALTKPGPFGSRTIDFGHYYGVFENGQLVAMTGQRLHVGRYAEISAVCTHPSALGKGYATSLVQHQVALILSQGKIPFLHVRADNHRAISLYERLGFVEQGPMHFYFMYK